MATIGPDDICGVCGLTRDNHGDKQHVFNVEGQLIKKQPPAPASKAPPQPRDAPGNPLKDDPIAHAFVRLIEVLSAKDLLTVAEHGYIFGGFYASDPGSTQGGSKAPNSPPST